MIAASDIKYLRKLGANCVRIPLRYRYLFRKENCKGDIDFERLDAVIEKWGKACYNIESTFKGDPLWSLEKRSKHFARPAV